MADSDKNIVITPNIGSTNDPTIVFTGGDNNPITLTVLDDGTLSFDGSSGQLFSITDSLTGTIFSVNDVSGIPSIEVDDDGTIRFAEYSGNILIGTATDDGTNKVQINGSVSVNDDIDITSTGELKIDGTAVINSSGQWVGDPTNLQGPQGTQGRQGLIGSTGIQGTQGTQGRQGLIGSTGIQGTQGTQGRQGLIGSIGIQGTQGLQGRQGLQGGGGSQGAQGLQGSSAPSFTYGISAETATDGVNFRLTGSDTSTDDVKLAEGVNVFLERTDANTITIHAIPPQEIDLGSINESIVPSDNEVYDLGTSTKRWRDLYLSGTTIDLGGTKISKNDEGNVEFKDDSNNLKKVVAAELEIGTTPNEKIRIRRDAVLGSIKFDTYNPFTDNITDTIEITGESGGGNGAQGTQGTQGQSIQGAAGQNGSNGIQGAAGQNGIQGAAGQNGSNGIQGAAGQNGIQGNQGSQGTLGAQGATVIPTNYTFSVVSSLPGSPNANTIYFVTG